MDGHDSNLSSFILAARHAVALDERSKLFPPELFTNFDFLDQARTLTGDHYQQLWFPGDHGDVGGKTEQRSLGAAAFNFIAEGAELCGLEFEEGWRREVQPQFDGPVSVRLRNRILAADRSGPRVREELSEFAKAFMEQNPNYRPGSLRRLI